MDTTRITFTFDQNETFGGGTSLAGYFTSPFSFEETIARLVTLSGVQPFENIDDKVWFEFIGRFDGKLFTLYDYKSSEQFHIGAADGGRGFDIGAFSVALDSALRSVQPTPFRAHGLHGAIYEWAA
jgi:hypothetical protein